MNPLTKSLSTTFLAALASVTAFGETSATAQRCPTNRPMPTRTTRLPAMQKVHYRDSNGDMIYLVFKGPKVSAWMRSQRGLRHWASAYGVLRGRRLAMTFTKNRRSWQVNGAVSPDHRTIQWTNRTTWTQVSRSVAPRATMRSPAQKPSVRRVVRKAPRHAPRVRMSLRSGVWQDLGTRQTYGIDFHQGRPRILACNGRSIIRRVQIDGRRIVLTVQTPQGRFVSRTGVIHNDGTEIRFGRTMWRLIRS